MEKIHHVFISSTYADLIEERRKVSDAIAKAGFVPEGMEIFPATNQSQMSFIRKIIDRCDYYILVLAGKYGTVGESGVSFTEQEFNYADSKSIPILAFIHRDLSKLPIKLLEENKTKAEKLESLKEKVKKRSIVDFWETPDELATKALAALSQATNQFPGVGWVRGNTVANESILIEINELRKRNSDLEQKLGKLTSKVDLSHLSLAGLDEDVILPYKVLGAYRRDSYNDRITISWRNILGAIGPEFRTQTTAIKATTGLERYLRKTTSRKSVDVSPDTALQFVMHLEALGMLIGKPLPLKGGGSAVFYQLTPEGLQVVLEENAVKSVSN